MAFYDAVIALAPAAYYRLGETSGTAMVDGVGGHDGSYSASGVTHVAGLVGDGDLAAQFDGVAGTATVPYDSAWMGFTTFSTTIVVSMPNPGTGYPDLVTSPNWLELYVNTDGTPALWLATSTGDAYPSSSDPIAWDTPTLLTVTYDGATVSMYQGATLTASEARTGTPNTANSAFNLATFSGSSYSAATLDEWAVFDRALTASEVASLAAELGGGTQPDSTGTDTSNLANGRARVGSGSNLTEYPVTALPAGLTVEPVRIMAQTTPDPTLKNGRPV